VLEEDERRLQRERDIARATAPANYSQLESEIAAAKSEALRRYEISLNHYQREKAGYYRSYTGNRCPDGSIPPFREAPGLSQ